MNSLKLTNFKAHQDLEEIKFHRKNFLLYGDNGAGKSSIYEALKIVFYRDRLEDSIKRESTAENEAEKINEFYREFNNKIPPINDFELKINDIDFKTFNKIEYKAYMLSIDDIFFDKKIHLRELFEKIHFELPSFESMTEMNRAGRGIFQRTRSDVTDIQDEANRFLEQCLEDIRINVDISDGYSVKIEDQTRSIPSTKEIKRYYNEAKLNLVVLALLFAVIKFYKDGSKKNILILDDFITSLDMANRTFVMKYILEEFKDFQILLFTHNVYFYNLIMYLINDKICITDKEWQFGNLYEVGIEHKIYIKDNKDTVDKLEDEYRLKGENFNIAEYGNQLRHKFERLLYEFSKILMVGGVEESNKILEGIANQRIYFNYSDQKDSSDLIQGIEAIIQRDETKEAIVGQINSQINRYKIIILDDIRQTLNTLKLYRKVTMHSLSHGQTGQHNWSDKEIKQTLFLLKKLETNIKDLTNQTAN